MTNNILVPAASVSDAGRAADQWASRDVFEQYRAKKSSKTLGRQRADLALYARYLGLAGVQSGDLEHDPLAWQGTTWGLVTGFREWMLQQGYAIGSVNVRLSTVKTYCELSMQAGTITAEAYGMIRSVKGYRYSEGKNLDDKREVKRRGSKKALATPITKTIAAALKNQPDTPLGKRDKLLLCLLLDHGLRCSEIVDLKSVDVDLTTGTFQFYRRKVKKTQTHRMTVDTYLAMRDYFVIKPISEGLLVSSDPYGKLQPITMATRSINERVGNLGSRAGVEKLSPHDCRHYWATVALRNGSDMKAVQDAGGWNSIAMVSRYAESAAIANEGVKLG